MGAMAIGLSAVGGQDGDSDNRIRAVDPGAGTVLRAQVAGEPLGPALPEATPTPVGERAAPVVPEHPEVVPAAGTVTDAICALPWPCAEALSVAQCESTLRPDAVSWTGESFGLMQINSIHAYRFAGFWERWMEPEVNTAWAFEIWLEQGWAPWACQP